MTPARRDVSESIDQFALGHARLRRGDAALQVPPASTPKLQALYFGGDHPLDAQVNEFIAQARIVGRVNLNDPRMQNALAPLLAAAREPHLSRLDAVVREHERISREHLRLP